MFGRRKHTPAAQDAHGITAAAARRQKWPLGVKAPDAARIAPLLEPGEHVEFVTCGIVGRPMCHIFVTDRRVLTVDIRAKLLNLVDLRAEHITGVAVESKWTKTEITVSAPQGDTSISIVPEDDVPLLVAAIRRLTAGAAR